MFGQATWRECGSGMRTVHYPPGLPSRPLPDQGSCGRAGAWHHSALLAVATYYCRPLLGRPSSGPALPWAQTSLSVSKACQRGAPALAAPPCAHPPEGPPPGPRGWRPTPSLGWRPTPSLDSTCDAPSSPTPTPTLIPHASTSYALLLSCSSPADPLGIHKVAHMLFHRLLVRRCPAFVALCEVCLLAHLLRLPAS